MSLSITDKLRDIKHLFPSIAWLICSLMSLEVVLTEPLGLPIGFPLVPFLNGIVFYYIIEKMLI